MNIFIINILDVDETVGIDRYLDQDMKAYPNPEGKPYRMYLMNITGKVVKAETEITTSRFYIERGNLENGLYFIELRGPKTYRGKIIIE